jgi:GntR family transcriptional regulator/MocR family aminotransferase
MPGTTNVRLLGISLDLESSTPLYQQLSDSLRQLMLSGRLPAGARLPSSRVLAEELNISRTTVRNAFEQLSAEGYLNGTVGSGTRVSDVLPDRALRSPRVSAASNPSRDKVHAVLSQRGQEIVGRASKKVLRDRLGAAFELGRPALDEFPLRVWNRLHSRHRRRVQRDLLGYGEAFGHSPLRKAISDYLQTARSVHCTPAQVVLLSHWQRGVQLGFHVPARSG